MTQERIRPTYPLGGPFATQAELEQAITQAITTHRQDFFPLLERLVDVGTPGQPQSGRTRCGCSASNSLTAVKGGPYQLRVQLRRGCLIISRPTSTRPAWPFASTGMHLSSTSNCRSRGISITEDSAV